MLALLFIGLPLLELFLLLQIGDVIGGWNTIALVFVTGIIGVTLAKAEGLRMLNEIREQLAQGQLPEESLLSGLLLVIGGAFLLTPGVITDAFGLTMLVAPARRAFAGFLRERFAGRLQAGSMSAGPLGAASFGANFGGGFASGHPFADGHTAREEGFVDVEAVVVEVEVPRESDDDGALTLR